MIIMSKTSYKFWFTLGRCSHYFFFIDLYTRNMGNPWPSHPPFHS